MESNDTVNGTAAVTDTGAAPLSRSRVAVNVSISIALILLSGLVAGLTLGLLSLDRLELEVVKRSGSSNQRKWAARVAPLLRNPHWLLVSLVLINAACNTSLPIFLDRMLSPAVSIILATTAVLIFGEILPQAVCARHGIAIGGALSWVVRFFLIATSPISWPSGRLLDWMLGPHEKAHGRRQLKTLVTLHAKHEGLGGNLIEDEIKIIRGVLDLAGKDAAAAMTPLDRVFALPEEAVLNRRCLAAVLRTGLSRVPVWRRGPAGHPEFLGFLLTKEVLQQVDPSRPIRAGQAPMRVLPHLSAHTSLFDLLKFFSSGRSHLAVLTVPQPEVADLMRSLAGPGSTSSTRGSDSSDDGEDDSSSSSGSSSSSTSTSRSRSSAVSTGASGPGSGAAGGRYSRPSPGSGRWRTAEHRIRAVLRLLAGGRRKHLARRDLDEVSNGRPSPTVVASGEQMEGQKTSGKQSLEGQQPPAGAAAMAAGGAAVGSGGVVCRGGAAVDKVREPEKEVSAPIGELQMSSIGAMAAEQLSRTAAAVLQPEGAPVGEERMGAVVDELGRSQVCRTRLTLTTPMSCTTIPGGRNDSSTSATSSTSPAALDDLALSPVTTRESDSAATAAAAAAQVQDLHSHRRRVPGALGGNRSVQSQLRSLRLYSPTVSNTGPEPAPGALPVVADIGFEPRAYVDAAAATSLRPWGAREAGAGTSGAASLLRHSHHNATWLNSAVAAEEVLVPVGIITLEDVIEELMQVEILDETDQTAPTGAGQAVAP